MTRILTFAILAVIVIGAVRIVTLSSAQPVEIDDETLTIIARAEQGNGSVLVLRTVTLDNAGVPISYVFEPIVGMNISGTEITVVKRQDAIFRNGFDLYMGANP